MPMVRLSAFLQADPLLGPGRPEQERGSHRARLSSASDEKRKIFGPLAKTFAGGLPPRGKRTPWPVGLTIEDGVIISSGLAIVNRLWLHHFGQGLVATPNDFGWQSEPPSHPELLDWLALRLIENGWKLKPMHKLILASATWRQTSQFSPDKAEKDLENRLLWRFLPRRPDGRGHPRFSALGIGHAGRYDVREGNLDERSRRRSIYFTSSGEQTDPNMHSCSMPPNRWSVKVGE